MKLKIKIYRKIDSEEEDEKRDQVNFESFPIKAMGNTKTAKLNDIVNLRRSTARNLPNSNKILKQEINKNLQVLNS